MEPVTYKPLADVADVGLRFRLQRVSDRDPKLLRYLDDLHLRLGTTLEIVEIHPFDGPIVIAVHDRRHALGRELARRIYVVPMEVEEESTGPVAQSA